MVHLCHVFVPFQSLSEKDRNAGRMWGGDGYRRAMAIPERMKLNNFYRPHNHRLYDMIGRDLRWEETDVSVNHWLGQFHKIGPEQNARGDARDHAGHGRELMSTTCCASNLEVNAKGSCQRCR